MTLASILIHCMVGYLAADLLAGFWHFMEDRYFENDWPIIGKHIATPNSLHHSQPTAFLEGGYFYRNWTTIVPAMIGLAISLALAAPLWVIVMFVAVSQANQIHAWAHSRSKSRIVRGLQEFGFFQSPRHHSVHHRSPFDVRYCVMSDWLNPVLDTLRVWRGVEILFALLGARVKA